MVIKDKVSAANRKTGVIMGMKELKFDSGLESSPLAKMTDCYDTVEPRVSLTERRLVRALFFFAVFCGLGVAQLYLRFSIQEMKSQQRELQMAHVQLVDDAHQVAQENARLTDLSRLRNYATERLNMKETDPRKQVVVSMPSTLVAKYSIGAEKNANRTALATVEEPSDRSENGIVGKILAAIFDSDRAYARDRAK